MKRLLPVLVAATVLVWPAHTGASGHQLVVDGVSYDSTKEAGASIHWETYGDPQHAVFAERDQEWYPGDNGSEHLPCDYGIHWVSNDNVLTISHCLEAPPSTTGPTTTSTTIPAVTTTSLSPTTTSVSTTLAPTTTAPESTSTSSPATSTEPSTSTSTPALTEPSPTTIPATTQPPSSTTGPTTTICTTGVVTDGVCQPVGTGETTIAPKLPATGNGDDLAPWAVIAVCLGALCVLVARRRV